VSTHLRVVAWLFVFALLTSSGCASGLTGNRAAEHTSKRLRAVVDDYLEKEPAILGAIVDIDIPGVGSWRVAGGYLDSSRTALLEPDTRFIAGSVTKMFTAVLVLQLVEDGQVRLDGPLLEYLPPDWSLMLGQIEHADGITVEQALSHRSGLPDVVASDTFFEAAYLDPTAALTPTDVVRWIQRVGELDFRPGQEYDYCNVNYLLLGGLIEHVSGRTYRQSLQQNILDRIGLEQTSLVGATFGSVDGPLARGYSTIDGVSYDGREVGVEWAHAEGGIITTAGDLISFFQALAAGNLFSDAATYSRMCQPVGHNGSYGLGIEIIDDPDIGRYYGHRGSFMGSRAVLAHFPEDRMTVAISHNYHRFSTSGPEDLLRRVVRSLRGDAPESEESNLDLEGPELLADSSNVVVNEDAPISGEWDFAPRVEWSLDRLAGLPLDLIGDMSVDDDGLLYALDRGTAGVGVVDADGNLQRSFGGRGDGESFEVPQKLFVTPCCIHVLEMAGSGDRIKTYDKGGNLLETADVGRDVSPRVFVDDDRYAAVRSGPDPLNRPAHELLELTSMSRGDRSALLRFPAEDKLIMEVMVLRGRYILLEDDARIFPRLIVHFDGEMLYLGRSDAYVIKKIDLSGEVRLAFAVAGREREPLPRDYAVNVAGRTEVPGGKITGDTKKRFLARFPGRQTFYTKILTDQRGLIYVFVPDVTDPASQKIDIFSPDGRYLYHALLQLPDGIERIKQLEIAGGHLYALVDREYLGTVLVKYRIRGPLPLR
jgi:D-alanyl-D-alanine carboxypeptidase